jgi:hemin uptake protein HemP
MIIITICEYSLKSDFIMHTQQHLLPATRRFPTIDSTRLFAVGREIRITHEGEEYRLRITSNNKLILTK